MTTTTIQVPRPIVAPRGAVFFATLAARVLLAFERLGQARAAAAIRRLEATRASETAEVRELARQWHRHDPRLAAELDAAADRHEAASIR